MALQDEWDTLYPSRMDIFGAALLDFQRGVRGERLRIHRDDGFVAEDSPNRYFQPDPWSYEEPALALVTGSVLDVGCGAGRHLLWFEKQGIDATGIDASPEAIEVCRLRGCKNVIELDVMAGFDEGELPSANTITLFGNNVGIGGTFEGACALLRTLGRLVEPSGRLLLTGIDIAATGNPIHLAYHQQNIAMGRRRGEIEMQFEYKGEIGAPVLWYHPEPSEVEEIASASGWEIEKLVTLETGFFWAALVK